MRTIDGFVMPDGTPVEWFRAVRREIMEENEYFSPHVFIKPDDVVVDLGAHIGLFTIHALNRGAKTVYAVERDKENFECLCSNVKSQLPYQLSSFQTVFPLHGEINNTFSVEQLIDTYSISRIDFMKVDIEWGEYELFINRITTSSLNRIQSISVELHGMIQTTDTADRVLTLFERLSSHGFLLSFDRKGRGQQGILYATKVSLM